jgi:hypothetical protein
VSCHKCINSLRIPFISLNIDSTGKIVSLKEYSMWNTENNPLTNFTEGKESKQSECFKNDLSEFTLKTGQNSSFFPSNCAIGIFNSSLPIDMEHSKKTDSINFDY